MTKGKQKVHDNLPSSRDETNGTGGLMSSHPRENMRLSYSNSRGSFREQQSRLLHEYSCTRSIPTTSSRSRRRDNKLYRQGCCHRSVDIPQVIKQPIGYGTRPTILKFWAVQAEVRHMFSLVLLTANAPDEFVKKILWSRTNAVE